MNGIQKARAGWKNVAVECENIDAILRLPEAPPLNRSDDGTIHLTDASFGWPVKPATRYKVTTSTGAVAFHSDNVESSTVSLKLGSQLSSVEDQTSGSKVRVMHEGMDLWVESKDVTKLPEIPPAEWSSPAPSISGCNLQVKPGELVLVSGPVAAGKSTLLESLVGNTELLAGGMEIPTIAYQPQTPILFDDTIKANILFGISPDDIDERYLQISLVASTLISDFDDPESTLHAKRELTGCGNGGSELSGGQQARVAMARCFYAALHGAQAVILDDPLKVRTACSMQISEFIFLHDLTAKWCVIPGPGSRSENS